MASNKQLLKTLGQAIALAYRGNFTTTANEIRSLGNILRRRERAAAERRMPTRLRGIGFFERRGLIIMTDLFDGGEYRVYSNSGMKFRHTSRHEVVSFCKELIKRERQASKVYNSQHSSIQISGQYYELTRVGGLLQNYKEIASLVRGAAFFKHKQPDTQEEHIGIELECISKIPQEELAIKLLASDPTFSKFIHIKRDLSIQRTAYYQYTCELAVCVPITHFTSVMCKICEVLRGVAQVNASCGLHVHLDQRVHYYDSSSTIRQRYTNLVKSLSVLLHTQPASRRKNRYCKRNRSDTYHSAKRYRAVNSAALCKYRTLEVRLHAGTIDAEKIINWVKLLRLIQDSSALAAYPKKIASFSRLAALLDIDKESYLYKFYAERIKKFKKGENQNV